MATEKLQSEINLDLSGFESALNSAFSQVKKFSSDIAGLFRNEVKIEVDTTEIDGLQDKLKKLNVSNLAKDFDSLSGAVTKSVSEQKKALAQLITSGQKGSKEYKEIESTLKASVIEANKFSDALNQVENEFKQVGNASEGIKDSADSFGAIKGALLGGGIVAGLGAAGVALFNFSQEAGKAQQAVASLTGASGQELVDLTSKVKATSGAFETDFREVLIATNTAAKSFGVSNEEALNTINKLGASGVIAFEDVIAQFKEYSTQINTTGLSLEEFAALQATAAQQGVFDDKAIDTIKEAQLRLRELTPATRDALEGIGLSADAIAESLRTGEASIFDVIQNVSARLGELPDQSAEVGTAIADIFGGPGEDAGLAFLRSLKDVNGELDSVLNTNDSFIQQQLSLLEIRENLNKTLQDLANAILPAIQPLLAVISENLIPTISAAFQSLIPIVTGILDALQPVFENLGTIIQPLIELIANLLAPILTLAADLVQSALPPLLDIFDTLVKTLQPVVNIVKLLLDALNPVVTILLSKLLPVIDELLQPTSELIIVLAELLNDILVPLIPIISVVAELFANGLVLALKLMIAPTNIITALLTSLLNLLRQTGIIDGFVKALGFVSGVAKEVFQFIDGIVGAISGLVNSIVSIFVATGKDTDSFMEKLKEIGTVSKDITQKTKELSTANDKAADSTKKLADNTDDSNKKLGDTKPAADTAKKSLQDLIGELVKLEQSGNTGGDAFNKIFNEAVKLQSATFLASESAKEFTAQINELAGIPRSLSDITAELTEIALQGGITTERYNQLKNQAIELTVAEKSFNDELQRQKDLIEALAASNGLSQIDSQADEIAKRLVETSKEDLTLLPTIDTGTLADETSNLSLLFEDLGANLNALGDTDFASRYLQGFDVLKNSLGEFDGSFSSIGDVFGKIADGGADSFDALAGSLNAFIDSSQEGFTAFKNLALGSLLSVVDNAINLYIPQILAASISFLGPIAGPIASAAAIVAVKALLSSAKSGLGGAADGVIGLTTANMGKPKQGDTIPMMLMKGESVLPTKVTKREYPLLDFMLKGGTSEDYFNKYYAPLMARETVDISNVGAKRNISINSKEHFTFENKMKIKGNDLYNINSKIVAKKLRRF